MKIQDYVNEGLEYVIDEMGEIRKTTYSDTYISIVFPNYRVASICVDENKYSVAVCDYEGYFNWRTLDSFKKGDKNKSGAVICYSEDEVCNILEYVKGLGGEK